MPRTRAMELGRSAVEAARAGEYRLPDGRVVSIQPEVDAAIAAKVSIPPDAVLPASAGRAAGELVIQVSNKTTMQAGRRLAASGMRTLALNFANGIHPGGGFLGGARAQEETLCRSSALYATLDGDPMYAAHAKRDDTESSDWVILSPRVPFFREDDGTNLEAPWLLSVLTCAAPVAYDLDPGTAADLLRSRISRVLAVAKAYGHEALVLGAWGCGAFGNDPERTACDFRDALLGPCLGAFREVVFAVTDWSPERRFLGPFRDAFAGLGA